jgi:hypothetical protein
VTAIHDHDCEVEVGGGIFLKSMRRLRKYFEAGEEVFFQNNDGESTCIRAIIAAVDDETFIAVVITGLEIFNRHVNELRRAPPEVPRLQDVPSVPFVPPSQTLLSSTGRVPWLDVPVRITRHPGFPGYRGRVHDVRKDDTNLSGLAVFVKLDAGYLAREAWVDYDNLHRQK